MTLVLPAGNNALSRLVVPIPLAQAACDAVGQPISAKMLNRLSGGGDERQLDRWQRAGVPDIAGYTAWLVIDQLGADRNLSRATGVLDHAVRLHLHDTEPLLALEHAIALANQGKLDVAGQVAVLGLTGRTTDAGYDALDAWGHGPYEERKRRATPRPRVLERVRSARPVGRTRPNRYKW